jgi:hypothetical protein
MFPNFLGLGAPRSGTTWLHQALASHPQIYVPTRRKEIKYFDRDYEKGEAWYESFFPDDNMETYAAVGEITPSYLDSEQAVARIAAATWVNKFLVVLRHPVQRLFSHYLWRQRHNAYQDSFEAYIGQFPKDVARSCYGRSLQRYLTRFKKKQFLVLVSEDMFSHPEQTCQSLAHFLGVSADGFSGLPTGRVNSSRVPRHHRIFRQVKKLDRMLRRHDLDHLANFLRDRLRLKALLNGRWKQTPTLDALTQTVLYDRYFRADVSQLQRTMAIDLSIWERMNDAASNPVPR